MGAGGRRPHYRAHALPSVLAIYRNQRRVGRAICVPVRMAKRPVNAALMIERCRARQNVECDAALLALLQREGLSARGYEAADSGFSEPPPEREARAHYPLETPAIATESEWVA